MSLRKPVASAKRGGAVATGGTVSNVPGAVVYVQTRLGSGSWTQVRAKVSGTSVSGSVRLSRTGTWQVRYRLVDGSGSRWTGQYSTAYTVRVR